MFISAVTPRIILTATFSYIPSSVVDVISYIFHFFDPSPFCMRAKKSQKEYSIQTGFIVVFQMQVYSNLCNTTETASVHQSSTLPLNYVIGQEKSHVFGPNEATQLLPCRSKRDVWSCQLRILPLCKRSSIIRGLYCFCIPPSILCFYSDKPRPLPLGLMRGICRH